MFRSWKLGKLFGIDVYVHWTFLLLILVVFVGASKRGIDSAVVTAGFVATVFGCILLHEFGHALTARRFGISTLDITLYPIGGVARLKSLGDKPWEEFWIAVAGPAVNAVIAAVIAGAMFLRGDLVLADFKGFLNPLGIFDQTEFIGLRTTFYGNLLLTNVGLILFNMLPAFPMDGGRVLRALLTTRLGRLRGTEIAAHLSLAFTAIFLVAGFYWNPMLILISAFTYLAGQQELAMVRHIEELRQRGPTMTIHADRPQESVINTSLNPDFSGLTWDPATGTWTFWQNGRPVRSQWHDN